MGKLIKLGLVVAVTYGMYVAFFQADWYPVGSFEEGFTVEFPQRPKRDAQRSNLKIFGPTSTITYSSQEGYNGFVAMVLNSNKIKQGVISDELVEQGALDRLTKAMKGRLISTESGVHRGIPYSEMQYRLDSSSATLYLRTFHTDGRVYIFMVGSHTMGRTTSGRGRFFRSIRFPTS